jgi:translation initiation factor IF-1
MAKQDGIKLDGQVVEVLPSCMFRVKLENEAIVLGILGGKLRQHEIKVLLGDTVTLEMSPYDLTKGRITKRL